MNLSIILMVISAMVNFVQCDLIGYNRLGNNLHAHELNRADDDQFFARYTIKKIQKPKKKKSSAPNASRRFKIYGILYGILYTGHCCDDSKYTDHCVKYVATRCVKYAMSGIF